MNINFFYFISIVLLFIKILDYYFYFKNPANLRVENKKFLREIKLGLFLILLLFLILFPKSIIDFNYLNLILLFIILLELFKLKLILKNNFNKITLPRIDIIKLIIYSDFPELFFGTLILNLTILSNSSLAMKTALPATLIILLLDILYEQRKKTH